MFMASINDNTRKRPVHQLTCCFTEISICLLLIVCSGDHVNQHPETVSDRIAGTVTDIDGNVYQTVKIGRQWWMVENLKVTRYSNGDTISIVNNWKEWVDIEIGACCSYENDRNNIEIYGLLYNWFAVNDERDIAPEGWHVPSDTEWQVLIEYLGGNDSAGGKMKATSDTYWQQPNIGASNKSGFSALPAGFRHYIGAYGELGTQTTFWSSSAYKDTIPVVRELEYDITGVDRYGAYRRNGYSIRCVRSLISRP